jgi:hypothetical protein
MFCQLQRWQNGVSHFEMCDHNASSHENLRNVRILHSYETSIIHRRNLVPGNILLQGKVCVGRGHKLNYSYGLLKYKRNLAVCLPIQGAQDEIVFLG